MSFKSIRGAAAVCGLVLALLGSSASRVLAATPVITYAGANADEIYFEGSGFSEPVTVSLEGNKLSVTSVAPTVVFAKLTFPLTHGVYSLVVTFGKTTITTTLPISGIISGAIGAHGSVQFGHGFTVERTAEGIYALTFPAGSFTTDTAPTPIVQPVDGTLISEQISLTSDGGATLRLKFAADTVFTFIIVNSL
jgi:hypothetical protein